MPTLRALISLAAYADNQLLCSLCNPKCTIAPLILETQQLGLAVGSSSNIFHHKITPETISEGQKSQMFLGGMSLDTPSRRAKQALAGTPLFKILDLPLGSTVP